MPRTVNLLKPLKRPNAHCHWPSNNEKPFSCARSPTKSLSTAPICPFTSPPASHLSYAKRAGRRIPQDHLTQRSEAQRLLGSTNPRILRVLAAAYAEQGQFAEATKTARRGLELATTSGDTGLARLLENDIALYDGP